MGTVDLSKVTGIPFGELYQTYTRMVNVLWKYGPAKVFAMWVIVGIIYSVGFVLKSEGSALNAAGVTPDQKIVGLSISTTGSILEGISSLLKELVPAFAYLIYAFQLFQAFVKNAADNTTFATKIFT